MKTKRTTRIVHDVLLAGLVTAALLFGARTAVSRFGERSRGADQNIVMPRVLCPASRVCPGNASVTVDQRNPNEAVPSARKPNNAAPSALADAAPSYLRDIKTVPQVLDEVLISKFEMLTSKFKIRWFLPD